MEFLEARATFCTLSTAFVGEGESDGRLRLREGVNGNLKLGAHGTELAPDKAHLLVEHQRESLLLLLLLILRGREEGRRVLSLCWRRRHMYRAFEEVKMEYL